MDPTTETRRELKLSLKESLSLLKQLADEMRVDLHLGGMEAKERWKAVDARIQQAELLARKATDASMEALDDAVVVAKSFKAWFTEQVPPNKARRS